MDEPASGPAAVPLAPDARPGPDSPAPTESRPHSSGSTTPGRAHHSAGEHGAAEGHSARCLGRVAPGLGPVRRARTTWVPAHGRPARAAWDPARARPTPGVAPPALVLSVAPPVPYKTATAPRALGRAAGSLPPAGITLALGYRPVPPRGQSHALSDHPS